jgi:glutamate racemase
LLARRADTLVLGCTHYPFLRPQIAAVVGPHVTLIDTGEAVAKQVARRLPPAALAPAKEAVEESFWTTGDVGVAQRIVPLLWGRPVPVRAL